MTSKWPKRSDKIVLVVMLKNEPRINITFDSVKDYIGTFFIFDTGSTDDTVERVTNYCKENDIKLYLKQGTFVNFCVSRNELLQYVDDELGAQTKYLLLLDANDEMQEMPNLIEWTDAYKGPASAFYLTQKWKTGNGLDSYYNVRMVKNGFNWRFTGVVHEYIISPLWDLTKPPEKEVMLRIENVYVYQDRTKDDDKTYKRFSRDKELLYAEYQKDPHEPRTLFYLAQTCGCLGLEDEAYKFYILRLKELGFYEEVYQSFYRLGDLSKSLNHEWEETMMWYTKAYQHSLRAEPLVKIAEHYVDFNLQGENRPEWHTCYMYATIACQLMFPVNQILFVDKSVYTYKRHHLLGRAGFYVGRYKEGKEACLKAIEAENKDIDRMNLKFYLDMELNVIMGGNIGTPSLFAATFGDREVRARDEMERVHDRNKIVTDVINQLADEKRKESKPIASKNLDFLRRNNMTAAIQDDGKSKMLLTAAAGGGVSNEISAADMSQLNKMPRKDKRAQLRLMIKQRNEVKKQYKKGD
jgi:glycosyltransferase involved in cell wall biosynthesis